MANLTFRLTEASRDSANNQQDQQVLLKAKYCQRVAAAARAHASPQEWATMLENSGMKLPDINYR